MAAVLTIGVKREELEYVNTVFAKNGNIVDVTDQYQDVMATVYDVAIIIKDVLSDEELRDIHRYIDEIGKDITEQILVFTQKEWNSKVKAATFL